MYIDNIVQEVEKILRLEDDAQVMNLAYGVRLCM